MHKKKYQEALAEKNGKPLFIPFLVLGDPDKARSREMLRAAIAGGADALELGFPFSDPPADGPVIQAADARALASGMRVDDCFDLLRDVRVEHDHPIGLLVYYNLVLQRGVERFYRECAEAGVNSVLVADVPLEHSGEIIPAAKAAGIEPVCIVSELSSDERIAQVAEVAEGYLYLVSYVGTTGRTEGVLAEKTRVLIERVRRATDLPLFVGFGISTPEDARAVREAGANGVIVGSRIVREVPDAKKIADLCKAFSTAVLIDKK